MKKIKCKLTKCLSNEEGYCDEFIPTIINKLKPNTKNCVFYSEDFDKDYKEIKLQGGMGSIVSGKSIEVKSKQKPKTKEESKKQIKNKKGKK